MNNPTALFTCDCCGKCYRTRSKWIAHGRTHTGERPYICGYPYCGKSYTRSDHLRRHEWSHEERKPFICSRVNCDKTFATKQRLRRHELSHIAKTSFTCSFPNCGKTFRKKKKLAEHCTSHQPSCSEWKSVSSQAPMDKEADCYCRESVNSIGITNSNSSLPPPVQVHDRRIYSNNFCSISEWNEELRCLTEGPSYDQKVHDKIVFPCNYCAKTFSRYSSWLRHVNTHEDSVHVRQVFPCHFPNCVKKFTSSYNRMVHEKTVHERQYCFECSVCCRRFTLESSLQRHIRNVHNDIGNESNTMIEPPFHSVTKDREGAVGKPSVLKALCGKP